MLTFEAVRLPDIIWFPTNVFAPVMAYARGVKPANTDAVAALLASEAVPNSEPVNPALAETPPFAKVTLPVTAYSALVVLEDAYITILLVVSGFVELPRVSCVLELGKNTSPPPWLLIKILPPMTPLPLTASILFVATPLAPKANPPLPLCLIIKG